MRRARARLLAAAAAVAVGWMAGLTAAGPPPEPVRVALGEGLRVVDVGTAEPVTVSEPGTRRPLLQLPGLQVVRIAPFGASPGGGAAGLEVGARRLGVGAVRLEPRRGVLRVGPRDLVGPVEIWRTGEGLLLVNEVPLEPYVAGAVRGEIPERWPAEALRAMAVVARTYTVYQQGRNAGKVYHLMAGVQDQHFSGRVDEDSPAWAATRATAGQVLTWEGRVFPTFYHSDSGGFTEAPQRVFSGDGLPPLPGVRDEFSLDSPNYSWAVALPTGILAERLRQGGLDVGPVSRVTVLDRSPSSRVARIAIEHARGTTTLKGTDFRRLVGYDVLKSTLFVAEMHDGVVRFEGRGWGHGVGLSQFGAKGMAERGYTYVQILEHYYPGAALGALR